MSDASDIRFKAIYREREYRVRRLSWTKRGVVDGVELSGETWAVDPRSEEIELRQFVGLQDKTGKDVYYGDEYRHDRSSISLTVTTTTVAYWLVRIDCGDDPMHAVELVERGQ